MERQPVSRSPKPASQNKVQKQRANQPAAQHRLLALQRSMGNQAIQRLLRSDFIQAKLQISEPGDPYEQEADRVAENVMQRPKKPPSMVQRKCAACESGGATCPKCAEGQEAMQRQPQISRKPIEPTLKPIEEEEEKKSKDEMVQRRALTSSDDEPAPEDENKIEQQRADSVEGRLSASEGGGESLPDSVRTEMESAIGANFSGVKLHTNDDAAQMNKDLGAKAFTHGRNIYFGRNSYNPSTSSGRELLAHELTHVVQQTGRGLKSPFMDDESEKEKSVAKKDIIQRDPNVTAVNGPDEMPAGLGRRVTLRATAPSGTAINWSTPAGAGIANLGPGTGVTNTLTAPVGGGGGVVTVQAANAADGTDVATHNVTVVEVQQPTFTFAPPMPAFAPANTMDTSVCGNTATAAVVTVPAGRPVTWSIVGNRRGAAIDPVTGVITPSAQSGNIRVRATDNVLAAARNEQTLTFRARPTGIRNTVITTFPLGYGAMYTHTFGSSGGSLANVFVTERVFCGNDPFGFCPGFLPILPGNINAPVSAAGQITDTIGTPAATAGIDVNNFLPSPPNPGLPQTLTTPQIIYWRSDQCSPAPAAAAAAPGDFWVPFQNVGMQATLFRGGGGGANPFRFRTTINGVATAPEVYTGPALAAGGAPAGSVCAAGEGVSNVTLTPNIIGADGNALTTTAASATVRPGGSPVTWSFPGPANGATIVNAGTNPGLFSAGTIAGDVVVRAALTANAACFAEGRLRMREVVIGPAIRFAPASVRPGATTRATVATAPGGRTVTWSIQGPALGAVIARNPDNSATITAGPNVGRITIRATDDRDATKFAEASLVIG